MNPDTPIAHRSLGHLKQLVVTAEIFGGGAALAPALDRVVRGWVDGLECRAEVVLGATPATLPTLTVRVELGEEVAVRPFRASVALHELVRLRGEDRERMVCTAEVFAPPGILIGNDEAPVLTAVESLLAVWSVRLEKTNPLGGAYRLHRLFEN